MTSVRYMQHAQVGINITSLESLELFMTSASCNPAVGLAVEDLTLSIPPGLEYSLDTVQRCLRLVPNIESLVLYLPSSPPPTIFSGLVLRKIQLLSTNLPHACLPSFLTEHRSLRSLVLRQCGDDSHCPLRHLQLPHVTELQCPSRCLPGIVHDRVARATVNLTRLASNAALAVHSLSASPLYSLSVDFFSNDYDMLPRIAAAAPRLRKLKLVEKPRPQRRGQQSRRPWNDMISWHQALLQLQYLEEFALHTLVRVSRPRLSEAQVITRWASGTPRRLTPHPALYHIAILQPSRTQNYRQLTEWFKGGSRSQWERVVNVVARDLQL